MQITKCQQIKQNISYNDHISIANKTFHYIKYINISVNNKEKNPKENPHSSGFSLKKMKKLFMSYLRLPQIPTSL